MESLTVLLFLIYFFILMLVLALQWFPPPLGSFDHVLSVSIDFTTNLKRDARFIA